MQRLPALLRVTQFNDAHMKITLPDLAYATPEFVAAHDRFTAAADKAKQASTTLHQLVVEGRKIGSHDSAQMAAAKQDAADTLQAQRDAWQTLHTTLTEHRPQLQAHHAEQRIAAANRIRAAADELRQAAASYVAHSALEHAAAGNLAPRSDVVGGLLQLDVVLHGRGLGEDGGLAEVLDHLNG